MRKTRANKTSYQVAVATANMKQLQGTGLLFYTFLTFLAVLAIYLTTKDWKGFTAPEEVDLGSVRVPAHRRKHACHHHRR